MKISFLGSGKVGSTIAYTAMLRGLAQEIVMVDASGEKARGEALDILQCQAFAPQVRVMSGSMEATAGSDIVVITAGIPRRADEPRVLLLDRNATLIADLVRQAVALSPAGIIFIVTNPLDVMTQLAYQVSGLPSQRVIGMGTVLDTARYRSRIAAEFGLDARDIDAYVIGEHGETMVPVATGITVRGIPISAFPNFSQEKMALIREEVTQASGQVIALKGGTVFAPAVSACTVLDAIVNDTRSILPVCSYNTTYKVAVSLPTIVGRGGASGVHQLELSPDEQEKFNDSLDNIRKFVAELKSNKSDA